MKNRILYLKETIFEANSYTTNGIIPIFSLRNEISKLAIAHLFTIDGYRYAIKHVLPFKNKIPIYYSNNTLLFYIKSKADEKYFINYFEIFKICYDNKILILFKSGEQLELNISKKMIEKELKKINTLLNYLNNLLW